MVIIITSVMLIALVMKAVRTTETSVYFYDTTRRHISECCHLHTRCCEKLKFHLDTRAFGVVYCVHVLQYNAAHSL
jgi:hypothetical protein